MRRCAVAVATAFGLLALVGCQPASPTTSPSPTVTATPSPTYECTPEAGGDASPCGQADYEEMKAKDALYAEAEAVYRELFAENIRISRAGGVTEPTETVLATTEGAFRDDIMGIFRELADDGLKARGDDPSITVERSPGISKQGSALALSICIDATRWAFYRGEARVSEGKVGLDIVYFRHFGSVLKIIGADGRFVDSCDSSDA